MGRSLNINSIMKKLIPLLLMLIMFSGCVHIQPKETLSDKVNPPAHFRDVPWNQPPEAGCE